jgi:hypothetical protein
LRSASWSASPPISCCPTRLAFGVRSKWRSQRSIQTTPIRARIALKTQRIVW